MEQRFVSTRTQLRGLPVTDGLREQIHLLLAFYQQAEPAEDNAFMTGALHILLKEEHAALVAANQAIARGNLAESTLNLWRTASTDSSAPATGSDAVLVADNTLDAGAGY